ncbi:urea amidolyase family protein [Bifidobacterium adolescentis]|uniref:5-oxoprolinase subunit B/C family protein n=1 Tax=Bifidobacterium adolescentis TaxID=1680 RepID=UPI0022E408A3|nr:urea amidolyase family protein [Bifidobacterium adolescentis]
MRFLTCGADSILVELADLDETLRVFAALQSAVKHAMEQTAESPERAAQPSATSVFAGVKQLIPAARTVYVAFDPLLSSRVELTAAIRALNVAADMERHSRIVEIPVIYDGEDMADVADLLGISVDEVVRRHCDTAWSVAFVGFAPGFAYLTGGDPIFDVPRRKVPRLSVPAGAVGLAGTFSGVYPRVSSGGWQLLGHTETPMWDERADPPALLQPGDTVRFTPVRDAVSGGSASVSASVSDSVQVSQAPDSMSVSASTPALEVLRSGLLTTFQDDGRVAANMGVTGSGAADRTSSHLANALVGNPANTPVLEITGGGVRMRAIGSVVVAVTGASADVTITGSRQSQDSQGGSNGTFTPNSPGGCSGRTVLNASNDAADRTTIAMQQPVLLRDGDVLSIAPPTSGLRDYVAVRGGFGVATTLGSAATDTMSGIGLPQPWPTDLPKPGRPTDLYVRLGPRDDWFTAAGLSAFLTQTWTVTAQSNRVGLRLSGAAPVERTDTRELASEATPSGAIEVPTSGQPVIFLRDQPVTGGYPVIAVLEPESLDVAGQLPPGACVRFHVVSAHATSTPQPAYPTKEVR